MKNLIKGITLLLLIFSFHNVNAQVINIDWTNSGNSTQSNELVEDLIYESTDLTEEELQSIDLELVNEYLSNYYYSLTKKEVPEHYKEVEDEYSFLESTSSLIEEASKYELFTIVEPWIRDVNNIEEFRTKLRSSKNEILDLENGAQFYLVLDYSLQIERMNSSSSMMKTRLSGDCLMNIVGGAAAGGALFSVFPVVGTTIGIFTGIGIALGTSACTK